MSPGTRTGGGGGRGGGGGGCGCGGGIPLSDPIESILFKGIKLLRAKTPVVRFHHFSPLFFTLSIYLGAGRVLKLVTTAFVFAFKSVFYF